MLDSDGSREGGTAGDTSSNSDGSGSGDENTDNANSLPMELANTIAGLPSKFAAIALGSAEAHSEWLPAVVNAAGPEAEADEAAAAAAAAAGEDGGTCPIHLSDFASFHYVFEGEGCWPSTPQALDRTGPQGSTALIMACTWGNLGKVEALIEKGDGLATYINIFFIYTLNI